MKPLRVNRAAYGPWKVKLYRLFRLYRAHGLFQNFRLRIISAILSYTELGPMSPCTLKVLVHRHYLTEHRVDWGQVRMKQKKKQTQNDDTCEATKDGLTLLKSKSALLRRKTLPPPPPPLILNTNLGPTWVLVEGQSVRVKSHYEQRPRPVIGCPKLIWKWPLVWYVFFTFSSLAIFPSLVAFVTNFA